MKTMSSKRRRYLKKHKDLTLRKKLIDNRNTIKRICVFYKGKNVGIGKPMDLLKNSSNDFQELLKLDVKETIIGKSIYLII